MNYRLSISNQVLPAPYVYAFRHLQNKDAKEVERVKGVLKEKESSINSRYNQGNHIMQAFQLLLRLIFAPRYSGPLRALVIPAPGFLLFSVGLIDADNVASWPLCLQLTAGQSVTILLLLQQPRFRP